MLFARRIVPIVKDSAWGSFFSRTATFQCRNNRLSAVATIHLPRARHVDDVPDLESTAKDADNLNALKKLTGASSYADLRRPSGDVAHHQHVGNATGAATTLSRGGDLTAERPLQGSGHGPEAAIPRPPQGNVQPQQPWPFQRPGRGYADAAEQTTAGMQMDFLMDHPEPAGLNGGSCPRQAQDVCYAHAQRPSPSHAKTCLGAYLLRERPWWLMMCV